MSATDRAKRSWGEPLGPPPKRLTALERRIWHELVAAAPVPLRLWDEIWLATAARIVADWRRGQRGLDFLREAYRWLAQGRIPMRSRRRLLFPERPPRR